MSKQVLVQEPQSFQVYFATASRSTITNPYYPDVKVDVPLVGHCFLGLDLAE